ncbi:putative dirigent protein [Helianthus annuus]|uniref:Dirigent protein n=1 Tax=Helianthus annuus TaxID=4232 RepID=A0A251U514_HELAN|nr:putative dirigent protein [Helianthus annuus]KAJ0538367.1 putative dirigent protein [Helianthus annuus]KAJ0546243.1 putative dirigent protein [Helianthus annuus]KAJ0552998.1 putative dirigent protein [Helianthus annuus]KAJ0721921.1 putative dirigent protein [Helianthus annuus]
MDMPKPPFKLTPLACFFLLLSATVTPSFSARTLGGLPPPPQHGRHHHHRKTMTFYMPNILNSTLHYPPTTPSTTQVNTQPIPFSKPLGLFPPVGGIPVSDSNSIPNQSAGLAGIGIGTGISFSASDILREELEFGMVNTIDVDLLEKTNLYGLTLLGKAKGMYVASLENGGSQIMAMTTSFVDNEFKDELRFFGLHQADINSESHVSIIGGSGKYEGANGYATMKAVKLRSKSVKNHGGSDIFLLINVYLG